MKERDIFEDELHSNTAKWLIALLENCSFQDSAAQQSNSLPVLIRNSTNENYFCHETYSLLPRTSFS